MAEVRKVKVDAKAALDLCMRFLQLANGKGAADVETALMMAYCGVAGGVAEYPEATQRERARIVLTDGLRMLAERVVAVGRMSDADVRAYTAVLDTDKSS